MNFKELKDHLDTLHAESRDGATMAKSHGAAGDFGQAGDYDTAAAMRDLKRTPVVNTKGVHRALRTSMQTLKKSMGDLEKPVLGATRVGARVAAPKREYSPAEIEAAAHKALAAGAITGAEAQHLSAHLAISGRVPDEYMHKLSGHVPAKPKLLTKSQVLETASAMLSAGTLSASDAQVIDRCLSFDLPVPDTLMKSIRTTHAGLK